VAFLTPAPCEAGGRRRKNRKWRQDVRNRGDPFQPAEHLPPAGALRGI